MGFQRSTLKLVWPEDSELHGLEVRCRRPSIDDVLTLVEMEDDDKVSYYEYLVQRTLRILIDWNLIDVDKQPVPATEAGIRSADSDLLRDIVNAARAQSTQVAPPLPEGSTSGGPSLEESIPTETLSENLESSAVPA